MQWQLSDEQQTYQEVLRSWLGDVAPMRQVRSWLDTGDASTFAARFIADGWAGVGIDEKSGGQGGGLLELALTAEELARAAAPSAAWLATALVVPVLADRAEIVAAALAGEPVSLLMAAETQPSSATPLPLAATGTVTGHVDRVLAGDTARWLIAPVSAPERRLALVDTNDPGVTVASRKLLDRTRSVANVRLEAVSCELLDVPAEPTMEAIAARTGVLVAADTLGATARMLDLAVDYSKQRHQFGVPIGSFQAVKHAAATMLVGIEAARSVVYYAAASVQAGDPQSLSHAAAAKAQVTADGVRAADSALTMHGAIGYTWEHDLHLYYKRAKLNEPLFGSPSKWNDVIADRLALT